ncbi:hypothetical protein L226DRAFT_299749 [Lentinus tigrinus ALCF2SS1-7]|uniref:uncharacterized protein n=1 Tax=Lentinus tigrinus ALCF2SS1-7 TaxID=1328758 RepID=UPI001165E5BF|nr:hypothetical protein L226DRAFT_299749 [Lentinus tigrinus ALCF2SS1-7]
MIRDSLWPHEAFMVRTECASLLSLNRGVLSVYGSGRVLRCAHVFCIKELKLEVKGIERNKGLYDSQDSLNHVLTSVRESPPRAVHSMTSLGPPCIACWNNTFARRRKRRNSARNFDRLLAAHVSLQNMPVPLFFKRGSDSKRIAHGCAHVFLIATLRRIAPCST